MSKVIKTSKNNLLFIELSADIRNKLQTAKTALELLKAGKEIPNKYIDKALKDLEKVEEIVFIEENLLSHVRKLIKKGMCITTTIITSKGRVNKNYYDQFAGILKGTNATEKLLIERKREKDRESKVMV